MNSKKAYLVFAVLAALCLTGCQTAKENPERKGRLAPPSMPTDGAVRTRADELADKIKNIEPAQFAHAGYRIVDEKCSQYFDHLAKASNSLKMTSADVTAIGSAAAVITTLTSSSKKLIGVVAASFGLGTVIVDNVEKYAFATPYPTQTGDLVFKALAAYRSASPPESAITADGAADKVAGYARICTYASIKSLSEQAIAAAKVKDDSEPNTGVSEVSRVIYFKPNEAKRGVQPGSLTEQDFALLAYIADPSLTDQDLLKQSADKLTQSVGSKVFDLASGTKTDLLSRIAPILEIAVKANAGFAAQVTAIKSETTAKNATTDAVRGGSKVLVVPNVFKEQSYRRPHIAVERL